MEERTLKVIINAGTGTKSIKIRYYQAINTQPNDLVAVAGAFSTNGLGDMNCVADSITKLLDPATEIKPAVIVAVGKIQEKGILGVDAYVEKSNINFTLKVIVNSKLKVDKYMVKDCQVMVTGKLNGDIMDVGSVAFLNKRNHALSAGEIINASDDAMASEGNFNFKFGSDSEVPADTVAVTEEVDQEKEQQEQHSSKRSKRRK